MTSKRACVLVLGDLGRSPRMQYHCLSLSNEGYQVDFVGYAGSRCHDKLTNDPNIHITYLREVIGNKGLPRVLYYVQKVFCQTFLLLWTLFSLDRPDFILVQNPPSLPTLPIVWFYARIRGIRFIVDWHNYGFSILQLALRPNHPFVGIYRWCEGFFGSRADAHLCVTAALCRDLSERWQVQANVLYDRPGSLFKPISTTKKHEIFSKLAKDYDAFAGKNSRTTRFTEKLDSKNEPVELEDRPMLLVSSTSWTEDEDFGLLLDALRLYDQQAQLNSELPKIICVITGKGPLKEHYSEIIDKEELEYVEFVLPWLEPEDYPVLLAAADLGVCLHTSSSKLDLPMKVVDMFGCGVPVCAINDDYKCLSELVQHGKNGYHFRDSEELTKQLQELFLNRDQLKSFRKHLHKTYSKLGWEQSWRENAREAIIS